MLITFNCFSKPRLLEVVHMELTHQHDLLLDDDSHNILVPAYAMKKLCFASCIDCMQ